MKRSEINALMRTAKEFFNENHFYLPGWAFYSPQDWKGKYETSSEIIENCMAGISLTLEAMILKPGVYYTLLSETAMYSETRNLIAKRQ